jgi:serine-type D-Ala-D-Ala carboxypeptidase/endopeptidase (penicillin-binding protein 4)
MSYRLIRIFYYFIIGCLLPAAGQAQKHLTNKEYDELKQMVEASPVFMRGFSGFSLFDPADRNFVYAYQADKYFTPASNTKILTFFAAESILLGQMPLVTFASRGDTLQLWGSGNPLLLHPDSLGNWLRQRPEKVWLLSDAHYQDARFGEGWSWDDYPFGYQMEKAAFPIYGNGVQIKKKNRLAPIKLLPSYFQDKLIYAREPTTGRLEDRNIFTFGARALRTEQLDRVLPFRYSLPLAAELLQDTFTHQAGYNLAPLPPARNRQLLRAPVPDTLYRQLLQDSDNFLAEQLLLMCSAQRYGTIQTEKIIAYVRDTLLASLPQPIDWVDGSGLSRYNQFTPNSLVLVLDQLYQRIPAERLFSLFPGGGQSGTIGSWYRGKNGEPFVFAKTGTLRHIHCLSGYLRTATGKVFVFSFMHNNYPGKINDLRVEMARVLSWLHEHLKD